MLGALAAVTLVAACGAGLADLGAALRVVPELHPSRGELPFRLAEPVTSFGKDRIRGDVEVRGRATELGPGDLRLVATARETWVRASRPASRLVLNELHYDATVLGQRVSAGKKVLSWDVGFAFRPVDVLQREDRRALAPGALEGIPFLGWERFGEDTAWMVVWANPLRGEARDPRDDESLALRHYRRLGPADLHLVARASRRNQAEAGLAGVHVVREDLEWHGSVLYQRRHERLVDALAEAPGSLLATSDPVQARAHRDGVRALLGATLSWASGVSLLAEAWYDPSGSSAAEWRAVADLARRQASLEGRPGVPPGVVEGNVAWAARLFGRQSLLRENVFLRLSRTAPEGGGIEPALDVLFTPADQGFVVTLAAAHRGQRHRLEVGARAFGGPRDAAYRLLPEAGVVYGTAEVSF